MKLAPIYAVVRLVPPRDRDLGDGYLFYVDRGTIAYSREAAMRKGQAFDRQCPGYASEWPIIGTTEVLLGLYSDDEKRLRQEVAAREAEVACVDRRRDDEREVA